MENKKLFTLSEAAKWCGGTVKGEDCTVASAEIDSRSVTNTPGVMFVALKGENTDGHNYIDKAFENGAECVLCEKEAEGKSILLANDSLKALGDIAKGFKENKRNIKKTVAVTGSVGKTTTKEFLASVFSTTYKTHKTEGNYNSVIGLPLTVFNIEPDTEAAVFEMGMSAKGEIEAMVDIAYPDGAIITNIGTSHMEMLGSRENILKAKLEITKHFGKDNILVLNGDDPYLLSEKEKTVPYRRIYASLFNEESDFVGKNVVFSHDGVTYDIYIKEKNITVTDVRIPAVGMHNVYNSLLVFALSYLMGISVDNIKDGLMNYKTTGMRQKIYDVGNYTIMADCYNASPESVKASSEALVRLARDKKVSSHAVLGEMRELGAASASLHRQTGKNVYENGVDHLYLWGTNASLIGEGAIEAGMRCERVFTFSDGCDYSELTAKLAENIKDGDIIMFKASRYVKLENAIENFEGYLKCE